MSVTEPALSRAGKARPDLAAKVAEVLADPVLVIDAAVEVVWGNRAAEILFGMTIDEAQGLSGLDLIHPDDLEIAALALVSVQSKEIGTLLEIRVRAADSWRLVEVRGSTLGEFTVLSLRDLTDRRRWELAGDETSKFRSLLQNGATVTMLLNASGDILSSSGALTRLLGHDQEAVEGSPFACLVAAEDQPTWQAAVDRAVEQGAVGAAARLTVDVVMRHADGTSVPYSLTIVNLIDDPSVQGLIISGHDITDRMLAESSLQAANSVLAATLEATADGILVVDIEGRMISSNGRFAEMWSVPREFLERADSELTLDHVLRQVRDGDAFVERLNELYSQPEAESRDLIDFVDGRVLERDSRPQRIGGVVVGRVWSFRDVSEERRLRDELMRQAFHDSLTDLANKALFRNRAEHAADRIARSGDRIAVLFIDVDDFKTVNDSLGHVAGDQLLVAVADRLQRAVRTADTVARLGGDEFAILMEDLGSKDAARQLAERLLTELARPVRLGSSEIICTVSIGICFGEAGQPVEDLLRNADLAMYRAKARGKGCYQEYATELHAAAMARLDTEANLRRAVREHEMVVHYQPVWDLASGSIEAFEALVRWQHPERGLVGPGEFIPFAEESGLIDLIGEYVLASACREVASWSEMFTDQTLPKMSVNLSARQLLDRRLPGRVDAILERHGVSANQLILEVTESALMRDPQMAVASLRALRSLGVGLAVDDFGTGYSSLAYLKQFPIDFLKIDKAFVDDVAAHPDRSLAGAIVQLAHTLGLRPVAEGVEHADQADALRSLGCGLAQGFHLGRPVDAGATRTLLARVLSAGVPVAT